MDKETILDAIAPCSFCCYTCHAKKNGIIAETAKKLLNYHLGYYEFRYRTSRKRYGKSIKEDKCFLKRLEETAKAPCNGCRSGEHGKYCIKDCFIRECTVAHGVDFCGECTEFPCDKGKNLFSNTDLSFSDNVLSDWISGNGRIKEVGVDQYYKEATSRSHYLSFSKYKEGESHQK